MLPGTGGLTRVVDKRGVRRDLADVFSTTAEGIRGERAVRWRLVDAVAKARDLDAEVQRRVAELAAGSPRPGSGAQGVALTPLRRETTEDGFRYEHVRVALDRDSGTATITVLGPAAVPASVEELQGQGDQGWFLAMTRQLDDTILHLRTNELSLGTWLLRTEGDPALVAAHDELLLAGREHWLVNELIGYYKRTVKRLDTTSRSLFALIQPGSCFVGALAEIALAADRQYMLDGRFEDDDDPEPPAVLRLGRVQHGAAADGQRPDPAAGPVPRQRRGPGRRRGRRRPGPARGRRRCARPGHRHAGRHRLGRRGPPRRRGAGRASPPTP